MTVEGLKKSVSTEKWQNTKELLDGACTKMATACVYRFFYSDCTVARNGTTRFKYLTGVF